MGQKESVFKQIYGWYVFGQYFLDLMVELHALVLVHLPLHLLKKFINLVVMRGI